MNENARAVCVTNSWLTATKIPHTKSTKKGYDIEVTSKDGEILYVAVQADDSIPTPVERCVIVAARQLASSKKLDALEAFYRITEVAGYGRPLPSDRGPDPDRKLNINNEFELVAMRHCDFRHAPNPSKEKFKQYETIISNVVRYYGNRAGNRALLQRCGYSDGDLKTFALVWTTNYIHKFTIEDARDHDNQKLLTAYLKQRFNEFFPLLWKKASCWFPALDVVTSGLYTGVAGVNEIKRFSTYNAVSELAWSPVKEKDALATALTIYQPPAAKSSDRQAPCFMYDSLRATYVSDPRIAEGEDPEYVIRNNKLDKTSFAKRRQSASDLLAQNLLALPHNRRMEVLIEAAQNPSFCFESRKEAVRQIKAHRKGCLVVECVLAQTILAKVNENMGGVDTRGEEE